MQVNEVIEKLEKISLKLGNKHVYIKIDNITRRLQAIDFKSFDVYETNKHQRSDVTIYGIILQGIYPS